MDTSTTKMVTETIQSRRVKGSIWYRNADFPMLGIQIDDQGTLVSAAYDGTAYRPTGDMEVKWGQMATAKDWHYLGGLGATALTTFIHMHDWKQFYMYCFGGDQYYVRVGDWCYAVECRHNGFELVYTAAPQKGRLSLVELANMCRDKQMSGVLVTNVVPDIAKEFEWKYNQYLGAERAIFARMDNIVAGMAKHHGLTAGKVHDILRDYVAGLPKAETK